MNSCTLVALVMLYHAKFKHKIKKDLASFTFIIEEINIIITCKEKCFVSIGIFCKNVSEKGFSLNRQRFYIVAVYT